METPSETHSTEIKRLRKRVKRLEKRLERIEYPGPPQGGGHAPIPTAMPDYIQRIPQPYGGAAGDYIGIQPFTT